MFESQVFRRSFLALLAASSLAATVASAQTTGEASASLQQKKSAEAAIEADGEVQAASPQIMLFRDTLHDEGMVAEAQQPGSTSVEDQAKVIKDKIQSEFAYTLDGSSRLVKGKPYAATGVTETTQVLADGNRIVRNWDTKFYRDSAGRTRREQTLGALQTSSEKPAEVKVFIYDPVGKTDYIMDPGSKTARKLTNHLFVIRDGGETSEALAPPTMELTVGDSQQVGHIALMPPLNEAHDIQNEDLGERTIEGLLCTGKRITFTIRAGLIGNERPIVITRESWYSKDIEALVESKTNDPRSGETHYVLQNVERGEQPISLFEPSAEYRLEQNGNKLGPILAPDKP